MDFYFDCKIVNGRASGPEDALTNTLEMPASGSYVDVSGFEEVDIVIKLGAVADNFVLAVYESDAVDGTADALTTLTKTLAAATDDDQVIVYHIATENLSEDHHFLTVKASSISGTNYADVTYFLHGARHLPVTQPTSLPSDNHVALAG